MMKNFEKKETDLNQLIDKLAKLNTSYSQFGFDNKSWFFSDRRGWAAYESYYN